MQLGTEEETKAAEAAKLVRSGEVPVVTVRVTRSFTSLNDLAREIEGTLHKYGVLDPNLKVHWELQSGNPGVLLAFYLGKR